MQTDRSTASARWVLTEFYASPWMCRYESGNEWLRPRWYGSDMTHRHFPVSSRHAAVGANRECTGYSSIRARSVASFHVYTISKKREEGEGAFTPNELALFAVDTENRDFILVQATNAACYLYVTQTLWNKFCSGRTDEWRLGLRC